jgi:4-hydroxy-2-oxoheptanedioate aldolase
MPWEEGRPTINGWLPIGSAFTAEIMAAPGYDTMTIDVRHGAPCNALDFPR